MKKFLSVLFGLCAGCASGGTAGDAADSDYPTYAHPATSVNDQFNVHKERTKRPAENAEFFFKRCSRGDARWPSRASGYDCDYPF